MELPRHDIDPGGPLEYSVVFTDRSVNHAAKPFISAMQNIMKILRDTYDADTVAVVQGGGSFAMESVARQFGAGKKCLVVRNGFFSYRWSQIFDAMGQHDVVVCKARPVREGRQAPYAPCPVEEVVEKIRSERPAVVFAPHVETAAGIMLPDDYIKQIAAAVHEVGGLMVLDCVASGAMWVSMRELGVDVLITAPQKGWSGTPGAGYVCLNTKAREAALAATSSSFAMDLGKWLTLSEGFADGKPSYHATQPTDGLIHNAQVMQETVDAGLDTLRERQVELGTRVRALLADKGFGSLAAEGFEAPSVVVAYTDDPEIKSGAKFGKVGIRVAAGVPLQSDEPDDFSTFRIGLFGLDKLADVDAAVQRLSDGLDKLA